jgi:predicted porin
MKDLWRCDSGQATGLPRVVESPDHHRLAGNIALGVHGLAASGQSNRVNVVRMNNSVRMDSPNWSGFRLGLYGALSENAANSANGRSLGAGARFDQGPWQAMVVWYRFTGDDAQWDGSNRPIANAAANGAIRADTIRAVAASYDAGVARVSGTYTDERNGLFAQSPNTKVMNLNVTFPIGLLTLGAGLQQQTVSWADGRQNDVHRQLSLAAIYALSKRTHLYTHLGRATASDGDKARLGATPGASSNEGQSGARVGVRHTF